MTKTDVAVWGDENDLDLRNDVVSQNNEFEMFPMMTYTVRDKVGEIMTTLKEGKSVAFRKVGESSVRLGGIPMEIQTLYQTEGDRFFLVDVDVNDSHDLLTVYFYSAEEARWWAEHHCPEALGAIENEYKPRAEV